MPFDNLPPDPILYRLLERTHFEPNTGCWLWEGSDSGNGYGKIRINGLSQMVHRVGWKLMRGPICPTFVLDHKCRCGPCWNPEHLRPTTAAVNTLTGEAKLFRKLHEYEREMMECVPA